MKTYATQDLRNLALVGHKGAGKTTLAEALLFTARAVTRLGRVEDGNTVCDFEPEERKHGGSVQSAVAHLEWQKHKINLIDTPGDTNFLTDMHNCVAVSDNVAVVVSAPDGLEAHATRLYKLAEGRGRCLVINKLGRERADFGRVLAQAQERLGPGVVPVTLPVGQEDGLRGVIDLLSLKMTRVAGSGEPSTPEEIPNELCEMARAARHALLEEISANDESILEKYVETSDLSEAEALRALRLGMLTGTLCPVFAVDAARNVGVQEMLQIVVAAFASPQDVQVLSVGSAQGQRTEVACTATAPFLGVVFKTLVDQHAGKVSVCRILSGTASKDMTVENLNRHASERVGALLLPQGKKMEHVDVAPCGDIFAVAKLKVTETGDTLAARGVDATVRLPVPPPPQITFRIMPRHKGDDDKISAALHRLREEDPSLLVGHDEITRELTLSGYGASHVDVSLEKLERKYGVHVDKAPPLVPYRETVARAVTNIEGKHKKQSGGRGQFGVCTIHVTPLARGAGYKFVDSIFGGAIPRPYIPAVDKGIHEALERGVLAGYPLIDVQVELVDGKYHDVDSSEMAFKIAGSKAVQAAARAAGVVLLEPMMRVEVEVPEEAMGDIVGDINGRRGRVVGMDTAAGMSVIKALVPMAEMLHYASDLKSKTAGRGSYTMVFDHYDRLPAHLVDRVIAESPKKPPAHDEAS